MAISVPHYLVIRDLYRYGMLPQGGALLEIGEANWYGDIKPLSMIDDITRFVTDPVRRDALIARLRKIVETQPETYRFDVVKVYYGSISRLPRFKPSTSTARYSRSRWTSTIRSTWAGSSTP